MYDVTFPKVFSVITDFLASNPTPEKIIQYRLPDELQSRAHELLERSGEGLLTLEEEQEMLDYLRVEEMIPLLKAKTRLCLKNSNK